MSITQAVQNIDPPRSPLEESPLVGLQPRLNDRQQDLASYRKDQSTLLTDHELCRTCERIELTIDNQESDMLSSTEVGAISAISQRKTTCCLCHLLYYLVEDHFTKYGMILNPTSAVILHRPSHQFNGRRYYSSEFSVLVVQEMDSPPIVLGDAFRPNPLNQRARPSIGLYDSYFSVKVSKKIRSFEEKLRHCEKHHTSCHGVAGRADPFPVYLIDTMRLCIIASTTSFKYFAFSYVWGEASQVLLTRENVDTWMQPGGLRQVWHSISRVIREAIQLISEVDLYDTRYLWVDSLCILSNDQEHKHTQISQMDAIYGQAVMIIVALAAFNASSSLFDASDISAGLGPVLREVEHRKNVEFIPDFRLSGTVIEEADKPGYVYRTRGWTFQEEQISRRLLYCTESGFIFRCRLHEWSPAHIWNDETAENFPSRSMERFNALTRWSSLVEAYTSRNLKYQSDALRAFTGIAESLQRPRPSQNSSPLTILCGICFDLFPSSLLWIPLQFKDSNQRYAFPTWSWASVDSPIRFTQPLNAHFPDAAVAHLETSIIVPTDVDYGNTSYNHATAKRWRLKIRQRAISILHTSKASCQMSQGPFTGPTDTFHMLRIRLDYKILRWRRLGLTIEPVQKGRVSNPGERLNAFNFDSIYMNLDLRSLISDYPLDNNYMNMRIVKGKVKVGGLNIEIKQFNAFNRDDTLSLIPLLRNENGYCKFLLAICVGGNLYERVGIGHSDRSVGWTMADGRGVVVNLI